MQNKMNSSRTEPTVTIGGRAIGPGEPCYLVTEVGTTCVGDLDKARQLIDAAAAAGMDAVKFQLIDPTQLSDTSVTYPVIVDGKETRVSMKEMFERLKFTPDEWRTVRDACAHAGLQFFATVDYVEGVDLLEALEVPVHKIGAWDGTFRPLVERIGATAKPMFVDLGPTSEAEMGDILHWYREAGGTAVLFLHDFHTADDREMNLRAVQYLNETQPWPAGFSSPARDDALDFAALALGARVIEKRLILDRSEAAFHAHESLEPQELKCWVERIRHVERALGRRAIAPSSDDRRMSRDYYRSICTLRTVRSGEAFSPENVGGKRPGTGLATARLPQVWGRRAKRDLPPDTLLTEEDLA